MPRVTTLLPTVIINGCLAFSRCSFEPLSNEGICVSYPANSSRIGADLVIAFRCVCINRC